MIAGPGPHTRWCSDPRECSPRSRALASHAHAGTSRSTNLERSASTAIIVIGTFRLPQNIGQSKVSLPSRWTVGGRATNCRTDDLTRRATPPRPHEPTASSDRRIIWLTRTSRRLWCVHAPRFRRVEQVGVTRTDRRRPHCRGPASSGPSSSSLAKPLGFVVTFRPMWCMRRVGSPTSR
jgi:hypothetical protein